MPQRVMSLLCWVALVGMLAGWSAQGGSSPGGPAGAEASGGSLRTAGPRTPAEEQKTFRLLPGFRIELVAAEPDVVDPVSLAFDEKGRLFVAEMRGYPNGGVGTGNESRGRIRCLVDSDGDGRFDTSTIFAEGLRFPMGLQPWRGGLIVAVAPDILYLQDTDGDGRADKQTVLYTNFYLANIQQLVNNLRFGLDNWVYACAGADGGTVVSAQKPDAAPVNLRNRGIRFQPDIPASLEPTSGGGQYGLTADDAQHWFTNTNSSHLRQIILPEHYLQRNRYLTATQVTTDIAEHGPAAKVFRISPFEPWRVERTSRRVQDNTRKYASTELVPGGFFTSACSPLIYTADLFPPEFRGNNFVCDPANNLIHREVLEPYGARFIARRVDVDREFLASEDNWFRPTNLVIGPEGAIYVADFYREVIETPLSLPADIKERLNLESTGRGRIWRIVPEGFQSTRFADLGSFSTEQLVATLLDGNSWKRLTAQRLLYERKPAEAPALIRKQLAQAAGRPGRANLLWTLAANGPITEADLLPAFEDPLPGNRENALRLAEPLFADSPALRRAAAERVADDSSLVRFQLAFSAGFLPASEAVPILVQLCAKDGADPWVQTAVLSSIGHCPQQFLNALATAAAVPPAVRNTLMSRVATMIGAKGDADDILALLRMLTVPKMDAVVQRSLLEGLGQGMRNSKRTLSEWFADPPQSAKDLMPQLRELFQRASTIARNESASAATRAAQARLLAYAPFDMALPALKNLLAPANPGDLQTLAVQALAGFNHPEVGKTLLGGWNSYAPALKREVLDAMTTRADRALQLLEAVQQGLIAPSEIDLTRAQQLKQHPDRRVKSKAEAVFTAVVNADRAKVVADYASVAELKGNAEKGRVLFKNNCAACHRIAGEGNDVGAPLGATIPGKSVQDLLVAVFDPNREVDPRYVSYQAVTVDGRQYTGIVVAETPNSITLRRAEGLQDTILRNDLESLRSTRLSLMPEGFEKQLTPQDAADLFAFLRSAVAGN